MVPFGAAASPDLTILPVFLAATTAGVATAVGSLVDLRRGHDRHDRRADACSGSGRLPDSGRSGSSGGGTCSRPPCWSSSACWSCSESSSPAASRRRLPEQQPDDPLGAATFCKDDSQPLAPRRPDRSRCHLVDDARRVPGPRGSRIGRPALQRTRCHERPIRQRVRHPSRRASVRRRTTVPVRGRQRGVAGPAQLRPDPVGRPEARFRRVSDQVRGRRRARNAPRDGGDGRARADDRRHDRLRAVPGALARAFQRPRL